MSHVSARCRRRHEGLRVWGFGQAVTPASSVVTEIGVATSSMKISAGETLGAGEGAALGDNAELHQLRCGWRHLAVPHRWRVVVGVERRSSDVDRAPGAYLDIDLQVVGVLRSRRLSLAATELPGERVLLANRSRIAHVTVAAVAGHDPRPLRCRPPSRSQPGRGFHALGDCFGHRHGACESQPLRCKCRSAALTQGDVAGVRPGGGLRVTVRQETKPRAPAAWAAGNGVEHAFAARPTRHWPPPASSISSTPSPHRRSAASSGRR